MNGRRSTRRAEFAKRSDTEGWRGETGENPICRREGTAGNCCPLKLRCPAKVSRKLVKNDADSLGDPLKGTCLRTEPCMRDV